MFGCMDPVLLYGFVEGSRRVVLDEQWLQEHFPDVVIATKDVVRNYMGEPCYGVRACIGCSGHLEVDEKDKKAVDELFAKFRAFHNASPVVASPVVASNVDKGGADDVDGCSASTPKAAAIEVVTPTTELCGPRSPHMLVGLTGDYQMCHDPYTLDSGDFSRRRDE
jgi:hypothetical protein